ncbi:MAG: acetate kinase, partial [Actinomycetota bacterium]|nr:acetate kinase [Actinomycetota bacterium]
SEQTAVLRNRELSELNTIILHIGNGASASAVRAGHPVDISTGMTTVGGLIMGTRPGDIDPGMVLHLLRNAQMTGLELEDLINNRSGLQGMCGDSDLREVTRRALAGDQAAQLAYDVYVKRIRRYVGAWMVTLGRTDTIVFTGGAGQNAPDLRTDVLANLEPMGIVIDPVRNESAKRGARIISARSSKITVAVIPTNEELAIARKAWAFV